jgi:hypothetical protein
MKNSIDAVISVACKKDLEVWRVAAPIVIDNIKADRYLVIVPDHEIEIFRKASPSDYLIQPEQSVLKDAKARLESRLSAAGNTARIGWYLQQLLKIAACQQADGERLLIWDADTVPLRRIQPFNKDGNPSYYKGKEHHLPYFKLIEKILGLDREVDFSFIAQNFPVRVSWLRECLIEIEKRSNMNWVDAIIASIDPRELSGFSEYETIGTYFSSRYKDEIHTKSAAWYRNGGRLVGDVGRLNRLNTFILSVFFDYISFESWDVVKQGIILKG